LGGPIDKRVLHLGGKKGKKCVFRGRGLKVLIRYSYGRGLDAQNQVGLDIGASDRLKCALGKCDLRNGTREKRPVQRKTSVGAEKGNQ